MRIFICINNLVENQKEGHDPVKIINKDALYQGVLGIFFYSNSVSDLTEKNKSSLRLSYAKERKIPIHTCTTSLSTRNLIKKIIPIVKVTGLGQLIEGVLSSDKTMVIGKI